ncbi:uncharacterized protein [Hetaerina americana]|uniref:uncharacterized protein n=1 Tax=Hetaerina americana TaxID=62018 RepID=UPI003A7F5B0D
MESPAGAVAGEDSGVSVNRVALKLPAFWPDRPALWFAQLEIQFSLAGITRDATKFMYAVSQLDSRYAVEVEDVITNPPLTDKYAKLKAEILLRLSASQETRIRQLLEHEEIGDRKPSQFLRHLRTLAGSSVTDDFLRSLWLGRLPSSHQTILATQAGVELNSVAQLADKIHEVSHQPRVASTAMAPDVEAVTRRVDELTRQVSSLTKSLAEGNSRSRPTSRRSNSRGRGRSASRHPTWCWYHDRFGPKATKCREPCTYDAENSGGDR